MRDTYSYLLATLPMPEYRQVVVTSRHLLGEIIDRSYHREGYLLLEQLYKVQMVESPKYWIDRRELEAHVATAITTDKDSDNINTAATDTANGAVSTNRTNVNTTDNVDLQSAGFGTVVYANCKQIRAFLLAHVELVAHAEHEPLIAVLHSTMHDILQTQSTATADERLDDAARQEQNRHEEYWTMLKMELDLVHKQTADVASDVTVIHPIEQAYRSWRQFYFGVRGEIARSSVSAQSHDERLEWPYTDSQYARNLLLDIENSDNPLLMTEAVERFIYDWMYDKFIDADSPPIAKLFWYYILTVTNQRLALLTEQHGRQVLNELIASNKQRVHTLITEKLRQAQSVAG